MVTICQVAWRWLYIRYLILSSKQEENNTIINNNSVRTLCFVYSQLKTYFAQPCIYFYIYIYVYIYIYIMKDLKNTLHRKTSCGK